MQNESKILFFCHSAHFISHFVMLVFPTLAFWIAEDFQLSLIETLNLGFWMYLCFGVFALPFGFLNDLVGKNRFFLVLFFLGTGMGLLALGFSSRPFSLLLGLFGVGVFAAIYHPVGMAFLSKSITNRGFALGMNGIFGTLGIIAAPFASGLLAFLFGWKVAYALFGMIPLALGILLLFVSFDESVVERPTERTSYGRAPKWLLLLLVLSATFFVGLNYRSTVSIAPAYIKSYAANWFPGLSFIDQGDDNLFGAMGASFAVSIIYVFGLFGQFFGGKLADKINLKWGYFLFHALTFPGLVLMVFATGHLLMGSFMVYIFFAIGMQPIENSLVASLSPPSWRGRLYGIKFVCILGSSALALKSLKWMEANYGLRNVFVLNVLQLLAIMLLLGLMAFMARRRTVTSSTKQSQAV